VTETANPAPSSFQQELAEFTALDKKRREIELELKEIAAKQDLLEEKLKDRFTQVGVQHVRIDGLTVYLQRQIWAGAVKRTIVLPDGTQDEVGDPQTTCDALIAAGHAEFVKQGFNVQTVSAWVRELPIDEETGDPILPPELVGKINITNVWRVRTRK
jgi:hypothetical protein